MFCNVMGRGGAPMFCNGAGGGGRGEESKSESHRQDQKHPP